MLFDGHSIKSRAALAVRRHAARPEPGHRRRRELRARAARRAGRVLDAQTQFSHVVDGRFKGGHITRHYGQPDARRARGAAGDVLALLHGRDAAVRAGTTQRAATRAAAAARAGADDDRLAAAMS